VGMDVLHSPDLFFVCNSSRSNVTGLWSIRNGWKCTGKNNASGRSRQIEKADARQKRDVSDAAVWTNLKLL
jgi:hypothetical protein